MNEVDLAEILGRMYYDASEGKREDIISRFCFNYKAELESPDVRFDTVVKLSGVNSYRVTFNWNEYENFCKQQWERGYDWDGATFSLDSDGDLFITARVGGRRVPSYRVDPADIFPDLAEVRRIYRRIRPEGGRFHIDGGGACQVNSYRNLPYFCKFDH